MPNESDWIAETVSNLPPICTIDEALKVLRMSRRTLTRLLDRGRIKAVKRAGGPGRVLIPRGAIADYLRSLDVGSGVA